MQIRDVRGQLISLIIIVIVFYPVMAYYELGGDSWDKEYCFARGTCSTRQYL